MQRYLLGVDSGSTVTKAVLFDLEGSEIGRTAVRVPLLHPHPHWVEQDLDVLWSYCSHAIRETIANMRVFASEIAAIGITAHGDGLSLIDEQGKPVRSSILSLDSRANTVLERFLQSEARDEVYRRTGHAPFAGSCAPLLLWLKENEPENYCRARWAITTKDWLKYQLTGQVTTDLTEASSTFTDLYTQKYSDGLFQLYGLDEYREKVPPILESAEIAGHIHEQAAAQTGLEAGTPVISGMHDMDACAIGTGSLTPEQVSIGAGTFCLNYVVSKRPVMKTGLICRSFIQPGSWITIGASPSSAMNLEWFVKEILAGKPEPELFAFVDEEVADVLDDDSAVLFHPYLYGSPFSGAASGAFLGLQGWHKRGHLLKAIFEGVVFAHKYHIDELRSVFDIKQARLSGGGSRSLVWSQMFADALEMEVTVTEAREAGALGAAICAGIGARLYASLEEAVSRTVRAARIYKPNPARSRKLLNKYPTYIESIERLSPVWPKVH